MMSRRREQQTRREGAMTAALRQVVERASTDQAFRLQLQSDPRRALAEYELTADERVGLLRGVVTALTPTGVERRVSKIENPGIPEEVFPTFPWN
jgi:hypothetical protein